MSATSPDITIPVDAVAPATTPDPSDSPNRGPFHFGSTFTGFDPSGSSFGTSTPMLGPPRPPSA